MRPLDQPGAWGPPGELLGDVDSQEPEAVPPEVLDELLGLLGVQQQVVGVSPLSLKIPLLHLHPEGGPGHRAATCWSNGGVGTSLVDTTSFPVELTQSRRPQ